MSERDDDDLEGDDKLTAMRTVWLSMRDEEPSDKGLAALMAAAREKAAELKEPTPTFWQKVLAAFRRPPVLALASVAILVGGAVVISNRGDKAVAEQTASESRAQAARPSGGDEARAKADGSGDAFAAGSAGSAGSAAPVAPVENAPAVDTTMPVPVTKPPADPPKPRPVREKAPERKLEQEKDTANKSEPPPPPPPAPEPVADKPTVTPTAPTTRGPQMKPPTAEPTVGGVTSGAGTNTKADAESVSLDGRDEVDSARVEPSRVLQMVKQCESAAARGDCAAVKALAARIKSQDAATYKARVVKNASIARCLE